MDLPRRATKCDPNIDVLTCQFLTLSSIALTVPAAFSTLLKLRYKLDSNPTLRTIARLLISRCLDRGLIDTVVESWKSQKGSGTRKQRRSKGSRDAHSLGDLEFQRLAERGYKMSVAAARRKIAASQRARANWKVGKELPRTDGYFPAR